MIKYKKPAKLNGSKLIEELLAAGISVQQDSGYPSGYTAPRLDADDSLWLAISPNDEAAAQIVLDAHQG